MSAIPDQAYWKFNNMRTEVSETPDGLVIRCVCCGEIVRFGLNGDPNEIGQTIIDHITKPCPEPPAVKPINFRGTAIAETMADSLTPKQYVAIRRIANAHGLNAETACLEQLQCRPEELSRRAASALIDWLKQQPVRRWS